MVNVMVSANEDKIGSTYINSQDTVLVRTCLIDIGHPNSPTKLQIDNTIAEAFSKGTLKQKRSKYIDMWFYWLQDRKTKGQFNIFWRPGKDNICY